MNGGRENWQPIESAPKDRNIVLWHEADGCPVHDCRWCVKENRWYVRAYLGTIFYSPDEFIEWMECETDFASQGLI